MTQKKAFCLQVEPFKGGGSTPLISIKKTYKKRYITFDLGEGGYSDLSSCTAKKSCVCRP